MSLVLPSEKKITMRHLAGKEVYFAYPLLPGPLISDLD